MKEQFAKRYRLIGLKIAYYRRLRGYTQEQLADGINRSPVFVGQLEAPNMCKALSLDTLFEISEYLNIPAYKFLIDDDLEQ